MKRILALIAGILLLLALIYFMVGGNKTPQVSAPQGQQIEGLNDLEVGEK